MDPRPNEKNDRNRIIYLKKISGVTLINLADEYGLSIERIHYICMKEEIKTLHEENERLKYEICKLQSEKK